MNEFQAAANRAHADGDHRRRMDDLSFFRETAQAMYFFSVACNGRDQDIKKSAIIEMADFIIKTANRHSADSASIAAQAEAVQMLCGTLAMNVQDKSLIPADFYARLVEANQKLSGHLERYYSMDQQSGYGAALLNATRTITAAAEQFRPAPAPREGVIKPVSAAEFRRLIQP